jgi:F0F1-type ATP synthase membrane subunit c/vacuolar-type H+-ATPase subunit K
MNVFFIVIAVLSVAFLANAWAYQSYANAVARQPECAKNLKGPLMIVLGACELMLMLVMACCFYVIIFR